MHVELFDSPAQGVVRPRRVALDAENVDNWKPAHCDTGVVIDSNVFANEYTYAHHTINDVPLFSEFVPIGREAAVVARAKSFATVIEKPVAIKIELKRGYVMPQGFVDVRPQEIS